MDRDTPVVILCGGRGTRIREASDRLPKAMVEVGGMPVLWHIMKTYDHFGFRRFILCLGYKGWEVKRFFLDYRARLSDFTLSLADGRRIDVHDDRTEDWEITFVETGLDTATGARLRRIRSHIDTDDFMMSYSDGVATVDLDLVEKQHRAAGRIGTVTGVRPTSRFGEMRVDGDRVVEFAEKPVGVTDLVAGGYSMFKRQFLDDYLDDDPALSLELEPLQSLARDHQLTVHEHDGFWAAMDTFKDYQHLNGLWADGAAPWKVWD